MERLKGKQCTSCGKVFSSFDERNKRCYKCRNIKDGKEVFRQLCDAQKDDFNNPIFINGYEKGQTDALQGKTFKFYHITERTNIPKILSDEIKMEAIRKFKADILEWSNTEWKIGNFPFTEFKRFIQDY